MTIKPFRSWLADLWRANCDEHDGWGQPRMTMPEYFTKYKWWLKREYQYQKGVKRGS
jgi:hypothetical protein